MLERSADALWAVADGMGGHRSGEAAATHVVEALSAVNHGTSGYGCLSDIEQCLKAVNASLFKRQTEPGGAPTGATVVALLAHGSHFACLWAGDSRAYVFREGRLLQISRDHSVVQQLVDAGVLLEQDRKTHPQSHVVTKAIGADNDIALDFCFDSVRASDVFLLCSDGLTLCLEDHEIMSVLSSLDLDDAADKLLQIALLREAPDNVSLILVQASEYPA